MISTTSIVGRTPLHNKTSIMNNNAMQTLQLFQRNSVFSLISPSNKLRGSIVFSELSGFSQVSALKQMVVKNDSFSDKVPTKKKDKLIFIILKQLQKYTVNLFKFYLTKILSLQNKLKKFIKKGAPVPKYLKLVINPSPNYEDHSSKDVLTHSIEKKIRIEKESQLLLLKKKKMNLVYTNKKNTNLIFTLLKRIQTRNGSITKSFLRKSEFSDSTQFITFLREKLDPPKTHGMKTRSNQGRYHKKFIKHFFIYIFIYFGACF